jgi:hypothetical protein
MVWNMGKETPIVELRCMKKNCMGCVLTKTVPVGGPRIKQRCPSFVFDEVWMTVRQLDPERSETLRRRMDD